MKNKTWFLNTVLTVLTALGLCAAILTRTFAPNVILPGMNIPALVLISVIALVVDHYAAPGAKRCYAGIAALSAVSFGLLPFAAGFITPLGILIYAASGGAVFTLTTWIYSMLTDRLSTGPAAKAAPLLSGFGLYLASQCLMGIIL